MTTTLSTGEVVHHVQQWLAADLVDWHRVASPHELSRDLWLAAPEAWIHSTFLTGVARPNVGVPTVEGPGVLHSLLHATNHDVSGDPSVQLDFHHEGGLAMTRHATIDDDGSVRWMQSALAPPSVLLSGNVENLLPFALGVLPLAGVGGHVDVRGDFFELGFVTQSLEAQSVSTLDRGSLAAYLRYSEVLSATDATSYSCAVSVR